MSYQTGIECQTDSLVEKFVCNRWYSNQVHYVTATSEQAKHDIEIENNILETIAVLEGFKLGKERKI